MEQEESRPFRGEETGAWRDATGMSLAETASLLLVNGLWPTLSEGSL